MGKVNEEEYFPRGRSSTTKPALRKKKDSLFKKHKKTKKKKNVFYEGITKKSKDENKITGLPEIKHSIRPLTYQTLEEGMVLLGRVREVLPYHMFVCLPGRLSAKVTVTGISAPYTEAVTKLRELEITEQECPLLTEMFRPGESVVCSVVEVKKDGELLAVTASLDPTLVNTSRSHDSVCAGHTLVGAVRSEEDHGYTLHTGVTGLTAFLPFKEAESYVSEHNGGRKLVVGEVVHCLVTKCASAKSSSRAEVTLDPARVARAVTEDITAQTAQPGTAVRCSVIQSTPSGLVVSLGNGKGYIESSQLIHPWDAPQDFPADKQLKAYVLYTLPHADFQTSAKPVYLTLNHIHRVVTPRIPVGEKIKALVTTSGFKGVWLCLGERKDNSTGNKGFITSRRLGEDVKKETVAKRFPLGKQVTVRLLAYDYMERLYNCSLEREKLDERYLKLSQLSVGDRVTCRVNNVDTHGLGLTLGSLRLYAFKEHCADVPPTNLSQHFSPGDIVDARVLKITETQALVTLKETLIRFPALTSFEMAHKNDCYWGVVRIVKPTHLFIVFYDNVRGSMQLEKPHPNYVSGQLVKCYVSYVNAPKEKLTLTAAPEGEQTTTELSVGEEYQLVVTEVSAEHLHVTACDYVDCAGLIPKCHLPEPCTYQEGDFLKAWLYLVSQDKLYFSPNPAIPLLLKKVEVAVSSVKSKVTCCVMSVNKEKVVVFANFSLVTIPRKLWSLDEPKEHQLVELFISKYDNVKNKIKLKCCRSRSTEQKLKTKLTSKDEETSDYFTDDATSKSDMPAKKKQKKKQDEKPECKNLDLSSSLENTASEKKMILLSNHTIRLLDTSANEKSNVLSKKLRHPRCPITGKKIRTRKQRMESESNDLVSNNSSDAIPKEKDSLITTNLLDVPVRKKRKRNQDRKSESENLGNGLKTAVTYEKNAKLAALFDMETELSKIKENPVSITEINISKKNKSNRKKKEESHSLKHEKGPVNEDQKEKKKKKLVEKVENGPVNGNKKENKKKLVEKVKNRQVNENKKGNEKNELVEKVEKRPVNESKKEKKGKNNKLVEKVLPSLKASSEDRHESIETRKREQKLTLSEAGFFWDVKPEDLNKPEEEIKDDSDEEVDEGKEGKKRKRGSERRRAAREEEARLREVECTLLETESAPQSADQFDRAVLARPDDADLWIKYMSHHLQATEIEKARAVARRALNTINQRHETERLNVWIALLNLENLFGTQESLKSVLDEALRTNDEFTVYSKMLQIYAQAKKSQNTEQLVGVMLRKFRSSPQCWLQCCVALMSCEAYDKARNILRRAVNDLPNKEHVNLLCKFALLENQHGFSEQAQTLLEHILTSYPKRIDIWSVYVDMLVKSDKLDVARQVLGRATKQKLPARKMKTMFSKWIGLEERLGSADTVENVKKLALVYVNNITKSLEL